MAVVPSRGIAEIYRDEVEEKIARIKLEHKITSLGPVFPPDYFDKTDFLLPNYFFPNNFNSLLNIFPSAPGQAYFPYENPPFKDKDIKPLDFERFGFKENITSPAFSSINFEPQQWREPKPFVPSFTIDPPCSEFLIPQTSPQRALPKPTEFVFNIDRKLDLGNTKAALFYEQMMKSYQASKYLNSRQRALIFNLPETQHFSVGNKEFKYGTFAFMNGVQNDVNDALIATQHISKYVDGYKTHLLYNGSQGLQADLCETFLNKGGTITPPVALYINFIQQYMEQYPDNKMFLVCHSQGAAILKVALKYISQEMRDRLIVRNYGGASLISETLCSDSINYVSKNDWVSKMATSDWLIKGAAFFGIKLPASDCVIRYLDPEESAPLVDHAVMGDTYRNQIKIDTIKAFDALNQKGEESA